MNLVLRIIPVLLFLMNLMFGQEDSTSNSSNSPVNESSAIALKTHLLQQQTPLNRSIEFEVALTWIGDMSRYQIVQIPQPTLTNLLLEGSGSSNRLEDLGNGQFRSSKIITYQLKPLEIGMAYIDGLEINYRDTKSNEMDVLFSQRLEVKVLDPLPEDTGGFKSMIYIVLLVIFFGAVFFFLIKFLKKRQAMKIPEEPVASLAEQYLNQLTSDVDPKGTNLPEMTVRMSKIFREYLSKEFDIPATESNHAKTIERLRESSVEEMQLNKLEELFSKLDMVKFAGGAVDPPEFSNMYGIIESFLIEQKKLSETENAQMKEA